MFSCGPKKTEHSYSTTDDPSYEDKVSLEDSGSLSFTLDERSTFKSGSVHFVKLDSGEYYSFLNAADNSLNLYQLPNKEILKKVKFDLEGPNGVGRLDLVQHLVINFDSIFIYNINQGKLFLTNFQGEVIDRFIVFDFKNSNGNAFPEPSNPAPLIRVGNKILLSCNIHARQNDYSTYKNISCLDLKTREVEYMTPLPEIYSQAFWGSTFKYIPSLCLDSSGKQLVASYPIDDDLYVLDLKGEVKGTKRVPSSFIKKFVPMKDDITFGTKNDINSFSEEQKIYGLSNSDFSFIKYDPYNEVYYRGTYLRPNPDSVKVGKRVPDFSIIILDKNFMKLGETRFDKDNFDLTMHFIASDGYYIARPDLYRTNEDEVVFTRLKLTSQP